MTRLHPFSYVFSDLGEARFHDIRDEALAGDIDIATMAGLNSTQRLLEDLGSQAIVEQDPRRASEYLATLFVAYRFWSAGQHTLTVDRITLANCIVGDPPIVGPTVPHGACYIEFPTQWFWATIEEGSPHEPLEGMFVVTTKADSELTIVAVLGLRPDRDGFSQITLSASAADVLASASALRDPPFAPVMDGGAEAGFLSVTSEGELLHLTHLALDSGTE